MKKALIIGGGLGGLASAILLSRAGWNVTILEKNVHVGGRIGAFSKNGFVFDTGPTLLLLPNVLTEFFKKTSHTPDEFMELQKIEPVYDVFFGKKIKISISSDNAKTLQTLHEISPTDANQYFAYLKKGQEYYDLATRFFLAQNVHEIKNFLNPKTLSAFFSVGLSGSYYDHVGRFFENEQIRAAFSFQSIYVGASPTRIPAAYSLIQFAEVSYGVWSIKGGVHRLAHAIEQIARENKVEIRTKTTVKKILTKNKQAIGVELNNNKKLFSDLVVCNADLAFAYQNLLEPKTSPVQNREIKLSCSAFMMYLGINKKLPQLSHNTFLLPNQFLKNLDELFEHQKIPNDPGIYLNCPSKTFPEMAPPGKECLYVLVPVPNLDAHINWNKQKNAFRKKVLDKINRVLELDIRASEIEVEKIVTPNDWKNQFNLAAGSTFGLAPTLFQSAFFRPQNRDPAIKNLYFVGASTHPGSGIPIVLYSAQNTVERILQENQ